MGGMTPPRLTDRPALLRLRAGADALFLRERVADETEDKLKEVNRRFTAPAVVTPFPQVWHGRLPGARLVADDPLLDLEAGAHDLVIHDLCLHWADDPVGQIAQCARALRPDGLFLATVFGGETLAPLRRALAEAEVEATGGLSPRILPMADIRAWGDLPARAGLVMPVADWLPYEVSYDSPLALMRDLRRMGEGNALAGRLRRFTRRAVLLGAAARHPLTAEGRAIARFEVITLVAWAPAPGQPRPLRPGSAIHRLADAIEAARQTARTAGALPGDSQP